MKESPKILLASPFSSNKDYVIFDWLIHISQIDYPNLDILLCDNSHDESYHKQFEEMGFNVLYVSPKGKNAREYITESQNLLRSVFLTGGYDYFLSLECDIFPPKQFLHKLLMSGKQIINIPYFYGFSENSKLLLSYFVKKDDGAISTFIPNLVEQFYFIDGTVKQIYESGIGCSLIHRSVLEKIKFRLEEGKPAFSDTYFYQDVFKAGMKVYMDTSMLCIHKNSNWAGMIDHVTANDIKL
jgi:GT2 family glycosyltransferase